MNAIDILNVVSNYDKIRIYEHDAEDDKLAQLYDSERDRAQVLFKSDMLEKLLNYRVIEVASLTSYEHGITITIEKPEEPKIKKPFAEILAECLFCGGAGSVEPEGEPDDDLPEEITEEDFAEKHAKTMDGVALTSDVLNGNLAKLDKAIKGGTKAND